MTIQRKLTIPRRIHEALELWFPHQSHGYNEATREVLKILREEVGSTPNPYEEEPRIYPGEYEIGF